MYDAGGNRLYKKFTDSTDPGNIIKTESIYVNGFFQVDLDINEAHINQISKHISDGQYIIATEVENTAQDVIYYTQNNIGSTVLLTDKVGDEINSYLYKPFGEMWAHDEGPCFIDENDDDIDDRVDRLFTGQMYDKESGLYYMNARYYDPDIGTFMTADPSMSGLNHYAYASCNPIIYNDPTGLSVHITITDDKVGFGEMRVVGPGSYQLMADTYLMTVTDDVSKTVTNYEVTRDAYTIDSEGHVKNVSFEPPDDKGQYFGLVTTRDERVGAIVELRDAENPKSADIKDKDDEIYSHVEIHIGGTFEFKGETFIAGSLGCFSLNGKDAGNKGRDTFINDILGRLKDQTEEDDYNYDNSNDDDNDESNDFY